MTGTLTAREAQQAVIDLLVMSGVPKGTYRAKRNAVVMLIGARVVVFDCSPRKTFYGLESLLLTVKAAINEQAAARTNRNQIDIEEFIERA